MCPFMNCTALYQKSRTLWQKYLAIKMQETIQNEEISINIGATGIKQQIKNFNFKSFIVSLFL